MKIEFVTSELSKGRGTLMGEPDVRRSGGQSQRVCIARGLCRDPEMLVLDRATGALDTLAERAVLLISDFST